MALEDVPSEHEDGFDDDDDSSSTDRNMQMYMEENSSSADKMVIVEDTANIKTEVSPNKREAG